ncbi:MAG: peroxiredoxin [Rhodospirillales bacterium]|nr:peroxiredoxin [Rhodospirillales bacterium]
MRGPKVGAKAPAFSMPTAGGGTVSLAALKGKNVIVYFYPKDDTPGCTKEACGFNEALAAFRKLDAEIVGISRDGMKSHDRFAAKYGLKFHLASDEDGKASAAYDTWIEKSMYGRKYMGLERSTYLVDGTGTIRAVWRPVSVTGHVEEVLAALKAL